MISGCYTALVTPFIENAVDYDGLQQLVDFQIKNGITGILAVGTTGESPVLSWDEHHKVIETVAKRTKGKCLCIAGAGSNNTAEALSASEHAVQAGVDAVLLVDPYYNGPSSLEIRKEYIAPVAAACPDTEIIPYVIPGRTGAQLMPQDLAMLHREFKNVNTVKEATGNLDNMKKTREVCGRDFTILSGDDALTYSMMVDPQIKGAGVISVASNIAPAFVKEMVEHLKQGNSAEAERLAAALEPLFGLVTVITQEQSDYGEVVCRARNPLGIKTLMSIMGMPSGGCRRPLGKMTSQGLEKVLNVGKAVYANAPSLLTPIADFFDVDIEQRLNDPASVADLFYDSY
jgi:4-hydroxy-tetrahydrodipicolinate synthase